MEPSNPYTSPNISSAQHTSYSTQPDATRRMRIKRMDVLSVAKMLGALYAVLGLIFGLIFGVSMLGAVLTGANVANGAMAGGVIGGFLLLIFSPIFYGFMGFVAGALAAFLYNFIAGIAGGIEFEIEG